MRNRVISLSIFLLLLAYGGLAAWPLFHKPTPRSIPVKIIESSRNVSELIVTEARTPNPQKGILVYIQDQPQKMADKDLFHRLAELSYVVVKIDWIQLANYSCDEQVELVENVIADSIKHERFSTDLLPIAIADNKAAPLVFQLMQKTRLHAGVSIHLPLDKMEGADSQCAIDSRNAQLDSIDLHANWYIFNSPTQTGSNDLLNAVNKLPNAKFTLTDQSNNSTIKESVQILQWLDPRLKDQLSSAQTKGSLPTIEVPASSTTGENHETMAVFLTGDGGWAAIDKNVATAFADKGIPTLGVDSLSYFWKARTPEESAKDIEKESVKYMKKWNKKNIVLIGYSFGADVMPFLLNRFSTEFSSKVTMVVLLSMGKTAAFEFKLSSWMNADKRPERPSTLPELKKVSNVKVLCVYGLKDPDSVCSETNTVGAIPIGLPGNHHFNDDYPLLMSKLFEHLPTH